MFCKKVVSRGRSSAVKWNQRESRLFEEVAVMAVRVSAVREVKGLPVESATSTPLVTTKSF